MKAPALLALMTGLSAPLPVHAVEEVEILGAPPSPANPTEWVFDREADEVQAAVCSEFGSWTSGGPTAGQWRTKRVRGAPEPGSPFPKQGREREVFLENDGTWYSPVYRSEAGPFEYLTGGYHVRITPLGDLKTRVQVAAEKSEILLERIPTPGPVDPQFRFVTKAVEPTTVEEFLILRIVAESLGGAGLPPLSVSADGVAAVRGLVEEEKTSRQAIRILGILRDRGSVPMLEERMMRGDPLAPRALAWIGGPEAVALLVAGLSAESDGVRCSSAAALACMGTRAREAVPALLAALPGERHAMTRQGLVQALASMAPVSAEAAAALSPFLEDRDEALRRGAALGLAAAGRDAERMVPLLAGGLDSPVAAERWETARMLGELGPAAKSAAPALERLLKDTEPPVRAAAYLAFRSVSGGAAPAVPAPVARPDPVNLPPSGRTGRIEVLPVPGNRQTNGFTVAPDEGSIVVQAAGPWPFYFSLDRDLRVVGRRPGILGRVAVSPDGRKGISVLNGTGTLLELPALLETGRGRLDGVLTPWAVRALPATGDWAVVHWDGILVVPAAPPWKGRAMSIGIKRPVGAAVDDRTGLLVIIGDENRIEIVDPVAMRSVAVLEAPCPLLKFDVCAGGGRAWIATAEGTVVRLDIEARKVMDTVRIADGGDVSLGLSPSRGLLGAVARGAPESVLRAFRIEKGELVEVASMTAALDVVNDVAVLERTSRILIAGGKTWCWSVGE